MRARAFYFFAIYKAVFPFYSAHAGLALPLYDSGTARPEGAMTGPAEENSPLPHAYGGAATLRELASGAFIATKLRPEAAAASSGDLTSSTPGSREPAFSKGASAFSLASFDPGAVSIIGRSVLCDTLSGIILAGAEVSPFEDLRGDGGNFLTSFSFTLGPTPGVRPLQFRAESLSGEETPILSGAQGSFTHPSTEGGDGPGVYFQGGSTPPPRRRPTRLFPWD